MIVNQIDPAQDQRWAELVERHPRASVFHTVGWLQALRRTYGYEPIAFTTSPPNDKLKSGLVFCCINSLLTGRRLVSLPFSDHCDSLCDSPEDSNFLIRYLQTALDRQSWRYLELRSVDGDIGCAIDANSFLPAGMYYLHVVDLRPTLDEIFRSTDKDSVQRRIQRAERAGLVEKCGSSKELLKDFYSLFVATRSRHHLPPMPYAWFRNLNQCLGEALKIRIAYKGETPISAILTLQFKNTILYKYGCSLARFNRFGAIPWLLWRAIIAAKSDGATRFDLGRTAEDDAGLLQFKNHWTRQSKRFVYWAFPYTPSLTSPQGWKLKMAKRAFSIMPRALLTLTGRLLYRHIG
jgi:hypothetical protein